MNTRENFLAILNYGEYDQMPLVHFGYWRETLSKWAAEGHISREDAENWHDGNAVNEKLNNLLGFDWGYTSVIGVNSGPLPPFPEETIRRLPDGSTHEHQNRCHRIVCSGTDFKQCGSRKDGRDQ